jgi:PKD repeat protein
MNKKTRFLLVGVLLLALVTGLCTAAIPSCPFADYQPQGWSSPYPSAMDPFASGTGGGSADPFQSSDPSGSQAPCPFEDAAGGGSADPFPAYNPSASPVPCPFEDASGGGVADPFGPIDPSTFLVPCPFPAISTTAVSGTGSEDAACSAEECPPPADLDGDGTYEDLNGNGRTDFSDVILFFKNMAWIEENQPVCCFDYNTNGDIDFSDLIILFHKV